LSPRGDDSVDRLGQGSRIDELRVGLRCEGCAGDVECLGDELGFTAGKITLQDRLAGGIRGIGNDGQAAPRDGAGYDREL